LTEEKEKHHEAEWFTLERNQNKLRKTLTRKEVQFWSNL